MLCTLNISIEVMEHHKIYSKIYSKEKEMKKVLNFKKWFGPVFALIALGLMCWGMVFETWLKAIIFIAPLLSFCFTGLYSWSKNPRFTMIMFALLIVMTGTLSIMAVLSYYDLAFDKELLFLIAILVGAGIPTSNLIYGFEILNGYREDNLLPVG